MSRTPGRRGRIAQGGGLVAGIAALSVGSVAVGIELERRMLAKRLSRTTALALEPFFGLRAPGPEVVTPDGVRLHVEVDEIEPYAAGRAPAVTDGATPEDGQTPEKAPTLVFVHGYVLSLHCWHFQRQHFRGANKMVFYDQRSHGESARSDSEHCRVSQLSKDLQQVLEATTEPDEKVVLIGHSMGGMTIQQLAADRPDLIGTKVVGAALIATSSGELGNHSIIKGVPGNLFSKIAEPLLLLSSKASTAVERGRRASKDLAFVVTRRMAFGSDVPVEYTEFMAEMIARTPMTVVGDFYPAFAEFDGGRGLEVLQGTETAVVGGVDDTITPIGHTDRIIEQLPGAESLRINHSGHMGIIEHHDEINKVLDNLIERASRTS